ncbi:MAG: DUF6174 domain-containing protein [Anaerolineae bacterium]
MERIVVLLFAIVFLAACGAPPAPTPDATATEIAQAMVVGFTLTAVAPTPTDTPTSTPLPTATPIPLPTPMPSSPQPTATLALTPESTVPTAGTVPATDVPPTVDLIEEAERLWETSRVTHYRIQVREVHSAWCYYEISLEVRNEEIITDTITAHYGPARGCWNYTNGAVGEPVSLAPEEATRWTVPGLFKIAHEWQELTGAENMRILLRFDTQLGYPSALLRDNETMMDDDIWLETLRFDPLRR